MRLMWLFKRVIRWLIAADHPIEERIPEIGMRVPLALIVFGICVWGLSLISPGGQQGIEKTISTLVFIVVVFTNVILVVMVNKGRLKQAALILSTLLFIINQVILIALPSQAARGQYSSLIILQLIIAASIWKWKGYILVAAANLIVGLVYITYTDGFLTAAFTAGEISITILSPLSIILMINMLKDVVGRLKIKEDEIERERERLSSIINNIGDAVVVLDNDGNITHANAVAYKLVKLKYQDFVGKHYSKVLKFIDDRQSMSLELSFIASVFAQGKRFTSTQHTLLINNKDEKVPVGVTVSPLKDDRNEVTGVVMVLREESEERRKDQMKSDFVSVASHQLRTPLTAIKWNTELLKESSCHEEKREVNIKLIKEIGNSADRMIKLVSNLLNLARIERNASTKLKIEDFDFVELINNVVNEHIPSAQEKNVEFIRNLPEQMQMSADKDKLFEVITNLISNAIKYSMPDGKVTLNLRETTSQIKFEISDNGIGIPEHQQYRIFNKFFRADNAVKHKAEGNGLGLYLAKSYVDAHGGMLNFVSIEQRGTTFVVTLPKRST